MNERPDWNNTNLRSLLDGWSDPKSRIFYCLIHCDIYFLYHGRSESKFEAPLVCVMKDLDDT